MTQPTVIITQSQTGFVPACTVWVTVRVQTPISVKSTGAMVSTLVEELKVTNLGKATAAFLTGVNVKVVTQGVQPIASHLLTAGVVNFDEGIIDAGVIVKVPVDRTSVKFTVVVSYAPGVCHQIYVQSQVAKFTTTQNA